MNATNEEIPTVTKATRITIAGMDRKGVGRMWSFCPGPKVEAMLKKLRFETTATCDGRRIGGTWKMNGHWVWAIESWAVGETPAYEGQQKTSYPS